MSEFKIQEMTKDKPNLLCLLHFIGKIYLCLFGKIFDKLND